MMAAAMFILRLPRGRRGEARAIIEAADEDIAAAGAKTDSRDAKSGDFGHLPSICARANSLD